MANIQGNNIYSHLTAGGTVVQATAPAILHGVTVNTPGVGAGTVLTLLDVGSAPGAVPATIAVIDTSASKTLYYDIVTANGLATSIAGATIGDVTVSYSRQS